MRVTDTERAWRGAAGDAAGSLSGHGSRLPRSRNPGRPHVSPRLRTVDRRRLVP